MHDNEEVRVATGFFLFVALGSLVAQPAVNPDNAGNNATADPPERWNLYYQATSIGQRHGMFDSPYRGPSSLQPYAERDVSLTSTLFFGVRLGHDTQFYFNPEIAGGKGLTNVNG